MIHSFTSGTVPPTEITRNHEIRPSAQTITGLTPTIVQSMFYVKH